MDTVSEEPTSRGIDVKLFYPAEGGERQWTTEKAQGILLEALAQELIARDAVPDVEIGDCRIGLAMWWSEGGENSFSGVFRQLCCEKKGDFLLEGVDKDLNERFNPNPEVAMATIRQQADGLLGFLEKAAVAAVGEMRGDSTGQYSKETVAAITDVAKMALSFEELMRMQIDNMRACIKQFVAGKWHESAADGAASGAVPLFVDAVRRGVHNVDAGDQAAQ